jgi:hypothetical protein
MSDKSHFSIPPLETADALGIKIPPNKAVVGGNAFAQGDSPDSTL